MELFKKKKNASPPLADPGPQMPSLPVLEALVDAIARIKKERDVCTIRKIVMDVASRRLLDKERYQYLRSANATLQAWNILNTTYFLDKISCNCQLCLRDIKKDIDVVFLEWDGNKWIEKEEE